MTVLQIVCLASVAVVLWRLLSVVATLDIRHYQGQMWRFVCLAGHWALIATGGVAALLGVPASVSMLLAGVALLIIAERRRVP